MRNIKIKVLVLALVTASALFLSSVTQAWDKTALYPNAQVNAATESNGALYVGGDFSKFQLRPKAYSNPALLDSESLVIGDNTVTVEKDELTDFAEVNFTDTVSGALKKSVIVPLIRASGFANDSEYLYVGGIIGPRSIEDIYGVRANVYRINLKSLALDRSFGINTPCGFPTALAAGDSYLEDSFIYIAIARSCPVKSSKNLGALIRADKKTGEVDKGYHPLTKNKYITTVKDLEDVNDSVYLTKKGTVKRIDRATGSLDTKFAVAVKQPINYLDSSGTMLYGAHTNRGNQTGLLTTIDTSTDAITSKDLSTPVAATALVKANPSTGLVDPSFKPTFEFTEKFGGGEGVAKVASVVATDKYLYVSGKFDVVEGVKQRNLARFNVITGKLDRSFRPKTGNFYTTATAIRDSSYLYVSDISTATGSKTGLSRYNLKTGKLDKGWSSSHELHQTAMELLGVDSTGVFLRLQYPKSYRIVKVDKASGKESYNRKLSLTYPVFYSSGGSKSYIVGGTGQRLARINAQNGKIDHKWSVALDAHGSIAALNGYLYVPVFHRATDNFTISRVAANSGTIDKGFALESEDIEGMLSSGKSLFTYSESSSSLERSLTLQVQLNGTINNDFSLHMDS